MAENDHPSGQEPDQPEPPPVAPPWPPEEPTPSEEPEEPPCEPAEFPAGFWRRVDYMLHHPESILESLRRDQDLWRMAKIFFVIALAMFAIYGAVMGGTNLLQASALATGGKFKLMLTSGIKVPVLFLATLVIVVSPVYVANTFVGPRLAFRQVVTVLLATVAITGIVLASTATVAFFFSLTNRSYHFIKLLHVFFFAYSALVGLRFFQRCIRAATPVAKRRRLKLLFVGTLALYAFVGMNLAWVLRPFIGNPERRFEWFRERKGSFYESVWESTREVLRGPKEAPVPEDEEGGEASEPGSSRSGS